MSLLTESWAGTTVTGRPIVAHQRRGPAPSNFSVRFGPFVRGWQGLKVGVVPLVEVGLASAVAWVVEELVDGESTRALMTAAVAQKTVLTPAEATSLVFQSAKGLTTLQRLLPPLQHGDVCPSTVMVTADGDARLSLVGLASALDGDGAGAARSELSCLAPEEVSGASTGASDVFRLGLVWLELLTGKTLFPGASWADVKARAEKYPGLSAKHLPGFPQPVVTLLINMLAPAASDRPTSREVETASQRALEGLGASSPIAPAAAAFARLFKGRQSMVKGLDGGDALILTPLATTSGSMPALQVGAMNAEGAVTLAKVTTKRMTSDEMAVVRANEATEAARLAAAEWNARHQHDEGNPKDFALGALLIERQKVMPEKADAALQQSQAFGSTLFYSFCFLGHLDEDEGLPVVAELLKQRFLTGPQLLELGLGPANAALLPRETAEQWQVVPLKLEAGGLTVAIADPTRADVLDDVKRRAKARSVSPVRATDRTLTEGLARVYDGKTQPPEWARPKPKPRASLTDELPALDDLGLPPPPMLSDEPPTMPSLPPLPSAPRASRPPPVAASPSRPPFSPPTRPPPPVGPPASATPVGPSSLDVMGRLFDAVLSLVPERGPEASRMTGFVRAVAKRSGAMGVPLEQIRLCAKALVIAALLEGKRAWETPTLPAVSAALGPHWKEFESFVAPVLDPSTPPTDPRAVVLSLCFGLAAQLKAVPTKTAEAVAALDGLRADFPPPAVAAVEAVMAR